MRYKEIRLRFPLLEWGRFPSALKPWLPSRGNFLLVALAFSLLLWTQHADALTGANSAAATSIGTIAYQGRLASAGGTPLTQTIGMEFRLYAAATGGAPLWTEQWTGSNSVQVSDGLFNVMLGSLTPIPQSVIAGNSNLFLGITVGTDSEMSPRVQLGSVPFAVQALTVPDGSITKAKLAADVSLVPPDGSVTNKKLALETFVISGVVDQTPLEDSEKVLAEITFDAPYNATYLAFVTFEANGSGGRSLLYLRDGNGTGYGAINHTSSNVLTTSKVFKFDLPAGQHVLRLSARTASTIVGQAVRAGTNAVIIPIAFQP